MKKLNIMKNTLLTTAIAGLLACTFGVSNSMAKDITIGVTLSTQNNPWFVSIKETLLKYNKKGLKVIVLDSQDDSAKELSNVEDLLSKKVDALLVNCIESKSCVSAVREAHMKHVPVITIDRTASTKYVTSYVAADNRLSAKAIAQYLVKQLGGKGTVAQLEGTPGATPAIERGEGFAMGIKNTGVKIVSSVSGNFQRATGMSVTEDILQSRPNINAIWAQNDEMALGAIQALKSSNKLKQVKVVGFDGEPDMIKAILKGNAYATTLQDPTLIAEYSMTTALKVLKGIKVPKKVGVPTVLITKANAKKFLK